MSVRVSQRGALLTIQLDREHKRNAIDQETTQGIDAALNRLEDDPSLRVGLLTGTTNVFSAGTDLKDGTGGPTARGGEYGIIRRTRNKPLIAAVEGVAFGGGFEIALACDLIVAARGARFALPEVQRGVVAASGALFRAIRGLPHHVAKELLLTGAELSAERAHHFGLVNQLAEDGEALEVATTLGNRLLTASPVSLAATMRAIDTQLAAIDALGWQATAAAVEQVTTGPDLAEGIAAFFERRTPNWATSHGD